MTLVAPLLRSPSACRLGGAGVARVFTERTAWPFPRLWRTVSGQLSNFLGLAWGRTVFGTDLCINSLALGHRFRQAHDVKSVSFLQMNLFRPAFRPESFDVVISNGVLHHTGDPRGGFESILRCLRPGGFIIIGQATGPSSSTPRSTSRASRS